MTSSASRRRKGFALVGVGQVSSCLIVPALSASQVLMSLLRSNRVDATTSCVRAVQPSLESDPSKMQGGFTLIELMFTIAIMTIVLAIATPSFTHIILRNRIDSIAHELHGGLQLARSEAVKRKEAVRVCRSNADMDECAEGSDWSTGWLILSRDDDVLKVWQEVQGASVTGPSGAVVFQSAGTANAEQEFSVTAPGCSTSGKKIVTLRRVGSSFLGHGDCDD